MFAAAMRGNYWYLGLALTVLAIVTPTRGDDSPKKEDGDKPSPPVKLTAQEDHKRMMELLKIKELRPGANGRDPKAANGANYDESKANPYDKLPDPLVLK